ncbi:hypothetical protein MOQ_002853 [Trypanosoma cruzi marinkellei]|uniref:Uncharacterized protein n=1 Tax=Trypanosoma cruzi marinkellei TaxID=85056 RepID=K2N1F5_TRYCR|nr:hypothetical protein MOQ_002853 [Trypanosoma cruzi marinkellei]
MQTSSVTPPYGACRHFPSFSSSFAVSLGSPVGGERVPEAVADGGRREVAAPQLSCHITTEGGQRPAGLAHAPHGFRVLELEEELRGLRAENKKLRLVEEQFWVLLVENEELRKAATHTRDSVGVCCGEGKRCTDAFPHGITGEKKAEKSWRASSCAHTHGGCMDLFLARELKDVFPMDCAGAVKRHLEREDSVEKYLLWLRSKQREGDYADKPNDVFLSNHGGALVKGEEGGGRGVDATFNMHPVREENCLVSDYSQQDSYEREVASLQRSVECTQRELKETRDMLELANESRAAALKDCARMSEQVKTLTEHLQEILKSNKASCELRLENEALNVLVEKQAHEIKVRDQIVTEMRSLLQRLQDMRSLEETSLSEENERARQQLLERRVISVCVSPEK